MVFKGDFMGKFQNKRLLLLGTSISSIEIVNYAKLEGAYVIVTDYLPTEKSAAKKLADETAMISTTDIDALIAFAKENNIAIDEKATKAVIIEAIEAALK